MPIIQPRFKRSLMDAAFVLGVALVCAGVYMIHPPSAFIVGGLTICALSALLSVGSESSKRGN